MKIIDDPVNPLNRGYEEKVKVKARVLINRIHFDEGYREADKGETVDLTEEDFDLLESCEQVEPEEVAVERDKRNEARKAKGL